MKKIIPAFVASLLLLGCASHVSQTAKQPIVKSTNSINVVYLVVSHSENVTDIKEFESVKQGLFTQVSKKAKIKTPNLQILTNSEPASGIVASVEI